MQDPLLAFDRLEVTYGNLQVVRAMSTAINARQFAMAVLLVEQSVQKALVYANNC
jgi:ABC-type branched-subunit amino acid transport system ATPase component